MSNTLQLVLQQLAAHGLISTQPNVYSEFLTLTSPATMSTVMALNEQAECCVYSCKNTAANHELASFRYCTATAEASGSRWLREELELLEDLQLARKA